MRHINSAFVVGAAAVLVVLCGSVFAGPQESSDLTPQEFLSKATLVGLSEASLATMALTKSSNPDVQVFAQQMVQDYARTNSELAFIAGQKNLAVPTDIESSQDKMIADLERLSGSEFDRAYLQQMVIAHSAATALFEDAALLNDAALAGFARQKLSTLRQHKAAADGLRAKSNQAGSRSMSGITQRRAQLPP